MQKILKYIILLTTFFVLTYTFGQVNNVFSACSGNLSCCINQSTSCPPGCTTGTCPGQCTTTCHNTTSFQCSTDGDGQCTIYIPVNCVAGTIQGQCTQSNPPPTCAQVGQQYCGGCINACRPLSQSCTQWIAQQCGNIDDGGGGGGGGWQGCGSCISCPPGPSAECVTNPQGQCVWDPGYCGTPPPPPNPLNCVAGVGSGGLYPFVDIPSNPTIGQAGQVWGQYASILGLYTVQNATANGSPGTAPNYDNHRRQMYSSNPGVISVTENWVQPWHNIFGPLFNWSANGPGTATITHYVSAKRCPACGYELACVGTQSITIDPPCSPTCGGALCGQGDGCGGTCPSTHSGIPSVPGSLSPANGTNITVTTNTRTISWGSGGALTNNYYLEIYPDGTGCGHAKGFCGVVAGTSYNYNLDNLPGTHVRWRVRAQNTSCGAQNSNFTAWQVFGVLGTISGGFFADPSSSAVISGGNCIGGGGATTLGAGASLTTTGKAGGAPGTNPAASITGSTFSVSPWYWNPSGNNTLTLNPGTAPNGFPYTCTCPAGCTYSGVSSPSTNRRFYIQQNDLVNGGWWQVLGGGAYAAQTTGVALRSYVPSFYCTAPGCKPFILGQNLTNDPDSAGVAVTGGGNVDSLSSPGNQGTHVTQRGTQTVARGSVNTRVKEGYDFFAREMNLGSSPQQDFIGQENDAQKPTSPPSGGKSSYYRNGNLTIQSPWQIAAGESITVFVNGDLTISDPTNAGGLIQVEEGGFLAFIVRGNIIVTPSVGNSTLTSLATNIEGIYVADGTMIFQGAGTAAGGDKRLVLAGTYVGWTNVTIQRDYSDGGARQAENNTKPATTVIFRPDFVINTPDQMKRSSYIWQETN